MRRVFCFGDSITFGERDSSHGGWVSRINQRFFEQIGEEQTLSTAAYNLGVGGETTDGLKRRFEFELRSRCHRNMTSVVVLQYGLNDMVIHKGKNRVPVPYFKDNLGECLKLANQLNIKAGLISILPFERKLDGVENCFGHLRFFKDIAVYNNALVELARDVGASIIEVAPGFVQSEHLSEDGIHPNSAGHDEIYRNVFGWLSKIV